MVKIPIFFVHEKSSFFQEAKKIQEIRECSDVELQIDEGERRGAKTVEKYAPLSDICGRKTTMLLRSRSFCQWTERG